MNLIDTHAHLYDEAFDADREEVFARASEAGVGRLLLPATDSASHERLFALCRRHPEACFPMLGLHPTSIHDRPHWRDELDAVERLLEAPPEGIRFIGVGEIGLDFYHSAEFRKEQFEAFHCQIELALHHGLPIAVHARDAWPETIAAIEAFRGRGLRGVFHAFSGNLDTYRTLKRCGDFVFGIGGVVTFKNSSLPDTVRGMALDDLVLETDCPYLTPAPFRGRRNEPAYVRLVCERVADLLGVDPDRVAAATTGNAERLFLCKPIP